MSDQVTLRVEGGFKYAWAVLFIMSVVSCLLSVPYLLAARSLEPKAMRVVAEASRTSPDLGHFVRFLIRLVGSSRVLAWRFNDRQSGRW